MKFIAFLTASILMLILGCENKNQNEVQSDNQLNQNYKVPQQQEKQRIIKQANIDPETEVEILKVLRQNINATKAKDVQGVLATIHEDSPQLESTKRGMEYVFNNYDLDYILEEAEVIEVNGDEAKVYYVQFTKALSGTGFADNRAEGIHIMKKSGDKWKIYKTESLGN